MDWQKNKELITLSTFIMGVVALFAAGFVYRWIHSAMAVVCVLSIIAGVVGSYFETKDERRIQK